MNTPDIYAGLDGAVTETDKPYLEPNGNYVVEVTNVKVFMGRTSNETLLIECTVVESDQPTVPVGSQAKYMVTDFQGRKKPDNKQIKLRNLIGVLAALANKDPSQPEQWGEVAKYASDTQCFSKGARNTQGQLLRGGRGALLRVKTGPMKRSKDGFDFAPHFFSHVEG